MVIKVDIDEFWTESDESLSENLKSSVTKSVTDQIMGSIEKKIDEEITRSVKAQIENIMFKKIQARISEVIQESSIKRDGQLMTIEEAIKYDLERNSSWSSPMSKIQEIAKKWGDEMKNRYDKLFAIHIVDQMRKNSLLKDDKIAELLVDRKDI